MIEKRLFPLILSFLLAECCSMSLVWADPETDVYLRWEFTSKAIPNSTPKDFWYFQKAVSLITKEQKTLWRVELPQRMQDYQAGIGTGEVEAHQQFPQQPLLHLYFLCGILYLDECIIIADISGVLGLSRKEGKTLFDYTAPTTESDFLFFDRGTFRIQYQNQVWTGEIKGAKFLTLCENDLVYFNRKTLILFKILPYQLKKEWNYDRKIHSSETTPSNINAFFKWEEWEITLHGIVYLK